MTPMIATRLAILAGLLLGASLEASGRPGATDAKTLEPIVVEPPDDFGDFAEWKREVEGAIAKGALKPRDALTARDRRQILVLEQDLPRLRGAIEEMERVISDNPRESMLSEVERLALVRAYLRARSVLSNVPDELVLRCRMMRVAGQRGERAGCDFDYARARQFTEAMSKRPSPRKRRDAKRQFTN